MKASGPRVALAALVSPIAAILFWMLIDDIAPGQAFASPFPYLLFALSWFVATPIYAFFSDWFGERPLRFVLAAWAGAAIPAIKAGTYFSPGRALFAVALIMGTATVAALTFWATLRIARR